MRKDNPTYHLALSIKSLADNIESASEFRDILLSDYGYSRKQANEITKACYAAFRPYIIDKFPISLDRELEKGRYEILKIYEKISYEEDFCTFSDINFCLPGFNNSRGSDAIVKIIVKAHMESQLPSTASLMWILNNIDNQNLPLIFYQPEDEEYEVKRCKK